ncbi:MAG TPA: carboxypeptidase regulatory-like domain-containing protein [Silvibacterium sp.]|nr:carboxypeptidase regulatory-like domain-containing protein [Silvibacterium sp.]
MRNRPHAHRISWIPLLLLLLAFAFRLASPQSDTGGSIAGQVSDVGGRLFPALVTLRNTATGGVSQTFCDRNGNFRFAELAPGSYSVRVSAPGLAAWKMERVVVEVGRVTLLSPKLTLAYDDNTVPAKDHPSATDLSPAISSNVDQQAVDNLPSSQGRWSDLAALSAASSPGPSVDDSISFRGLSPLMNSITMDGTDHNLAFSGRQRGTGGGGYSTAQSAIHEFQVNTSNFSAEYGHAAGAVINTVTKSGSNRLHGQASFYDRNSAWGASNAFTILTELDSQGQYVSVPYKPPDVRRQWGASAGGPIRHDKLFWFFAYDQHQRDFPGIARANEPAAFFAPPSAQTVLTLAGRTGQSPAAALTSWNNTMADLSGLLGNVPRTSRQLILFPKINWRPNNRNQMVFQYNFMRRTALNGVATQASDTYGIGSFGTSHTSADGAVAGWEYFYTPNLLNSARYQYSRELISQLPSAATPFEQQFANNALGLAPQIAVDHSSGFTFGTRSSLDKSQYPDETRQQFVDAVTWIHHRHALKFGYDYNYVTDSVSGLNNQAGDYSYSSVLNFVSDLIAPNHCDGSTTGAGLDPCYSYYQQAIGEPSWTFNTADYAAFIADDWKLSRRLTISAGVRYEYQALPNPGKLLTNPDIPQTGVMPHDRNNFGPRVGLAWDIFGSGRTVLRGGYGVYYGRISNATIYSALTTTGSAVAQRNYYYRPLDTGAPPFPYIFSSDAYLLVAPNAIYFDKHFQNPQIDQTALSLQQELGHRTALTVTYMGSYARELPNFIDTNVDLNALGVLNYTIEDAQHLGPIKSGFVSKFFYQRLNANYRAITDITSETNASYQAAIVQLTRRLGGAFSINAGYTYSHAIDDNQNESTFADNNDVYDPTNLHLEHGTSNFDVRQRASGSVVAQTPWHFRGIAGALFNGYSLGTSGEWRTGLPYSMRTMGAIPAPSCSYQEYLEYGPSCVTISTSGVILGGANSGARISGLGASLNGYGGNDILPQIGRNTFRYPGVVNLDVRASKRTRISDRMTFEVLAEAFNVLNHTNVTSIETIGYLIDNDSSYARTAHLTYLDGSSGTSTFGSVTNANSTALYRQRQIQAGCRFIF